jgi:hypothetical protein
MDSLSYVIASQSGNHGFDESFSYKSLWQLTGEGAGGVGGTGSRQLVTFLVDGTFSPLPSFTFSHLKTRTSGTYPSPCYREE